MKELLMGTYRPTADGGVIRIRRSKIDGGIHPAVEILVIHTGPGFEWSHVAPAVAAHGFAVEPRSNRPVGYGENFFFDFKLLREVAHAEA